MGKEDPYDPEAKVCVSLDNARKITKQILLILAYLHDQRIVHRDIKPENLMFLEYGNIEKGLVLVDFGFAKQLKPGEYCNDKHGTPYYIAPEILCFEDYDMKCDIWSTGIILYIMLTGRPPFNGKKEEDIQGKIKSGVEVKMRNKDFEHLGTPDEIRKVTDLLRKMLNADQHERLSAKDALDHPWMKINN